MRKDTWDARHSSDEAVKEELRIGEWRVFDHYEVADGPHGLCAHAPRSFRTPHSESHYRLVFQFDYLYQGQKGFRPLVDTPALFLEFAGLVEEGITRDKWLDWMHRYGVLGFEGNGEVADRWWASPRGGPRETLTAFVEEASKANAALRIYEAATSPGGPDVAVLSDFANNTEPALSALAVWTEFKEAETASALQACGLRVAWNAVGDMLTGHCYPELYRLKDTFSMAWGFKSLIGAMYLQMTWLMTAARGARRCQGPKCNKIIAYEQPEKGAHPQLQGKKNDRSAGYKKTRKDKRFCGNSCKSLWHYYYGDGKSTRNSLKRLV
jgi:hypothetical protein